MLKRTTVRQLLQVLRIVRSRHAAGDDLNRAYVCAVSEVKKMHNVEYATIADGCCRRLGLNKDGFIQIVGQWISGNPEELIKVIKKNSRLESYDEIDIFFRKTMSSLLVEKASHIHENSGNITIKIDQLLINKIQYISENEKLLSIEEWVVKVLEKEVERRMSAIKKDIIKAVQKMTDEEKEELKKELMNLNS